MIVADNYEQLASFACNGITFYPELSELSNPHFIHQYRAVTKQTRS